MVCLPAPGFGLKNVFRRVILSGAFCALLCSAEEDLSWIQSFTAPATAENLANGEAGRQNQLNWDPRFAKLLEDAFPQRQYFWFDQGKFPAVADLVHLFTGVPGYALLDGHRFALITGCVPHDCGDRGFLWIDLESSGKPLLVFAATGSINSDRSDSGTSLIHLRLFASQELNWQKLPPEFKKSFLRWWDQTTQVWTKYSPEKVALITLIQPSGQEVDLSPGLFGFGSTGGQGQRP